MRAEYRYVILKTAEPFKTVIITSLVKEETEKRLENGSL